MEFNDIKGALLLVVILLILFVLVTNLKDNTTMFVKDIHSLSGSHSLSQMPADADKRTTYLFEKFTYDTLSAINKGTPYGLDGITSSCILQNYPYLLNSMPSTFNGVFQLTLDSNSDILHARLLELNKADGKLDELKHYKEDLVFKKLTLNTQDIENSDIVSHLNLVFTNGQPSLLGKPISKLYLIYGEDAYAFTYDPGNIDSCTFIN